jgi:tyrosine-protein phosphatase SIW14
MTDHDKVGNSRRSTIVWLVIAIALTATIGVSYFGFWRYHLKRLQAVRPGVLYRVAQPTEFGLKCLVNDYHVRTVVSLQLFDYRLHRGWLDPWGPSGDKESQIVGELGAKSVQWPMGEEACWPWPTPWQIEAFLSLMDDPENLPVAIHCMGGRHRTGTLAALYRMEFDRWPAERAIAEMRSFDFDDYVPIQEHNLRTYLPRPHPDAAATLALMQTFEPLVRDERPDGYEQIVRTLRGLPDRADLNDRMTAYLNEQKPFALALAKRLIDDVDDPLVEPAAHAAASVIESTEAAAVDWQMAAALIADFGTPEQQERLLDVMWQEVRTPKVSPRYAALVQGVTNRYTRNRIAYLIPILADARMRPEETVKGRRYYETAVARLQSITDVVMLPRGEDRNIWPVGRKVAIAWLEEHDQFAAPSRLVAPDGEKFVRAGDGTAQEDLSRL